MHILREAGWPVYLVLGLGTLTLVQAVRYASRGQRDLLAHVVGAGVATLLVGTLATVLGIQMAFGAIPQLPNPSEQHWIALLGVKESLFNLDLALGFTAVAALIAGGGHKRALAGADVARSA